MEPPLREAGDHRVARQSRSLHEEHDGDGERGEAAEDDSALAMAGQEGGDGDGCHDGEGKTVGEEFHEPLHGWHLSRRKASR
jgi:hypothetical protein